MTAKKHIVIAGSTGEVGKNLVRLASAMPDLVVHALVRREGACQGNTAIHEVVFDYEDPMAHKTLFKTLPCDALFVALGTTTAKAGVQGLIRVDRDYPLFLIEALEDTLPSSKVGFCSAAGADKPRGHYLKAKFDVEQRLLASRLATVIARPSFLISDRAEFRPLETVLMPVFRAIFGVLRSVIPGSKFVWKYGPAHVGDVAERLLAATLDVRPLQHVILEGRALHTTH